VALKESEPRNYPTCSPLCLSLTQITWSSTVRFGIYIYYTHLLCTCANNIVFCCPLSSSPRPTPIANTPQPGTWRRLQHTRTRHQAVHVQAPGRVKLESFSHFPPQSIFPPFFSLCLSHPLLANTARTSFVRIRHKAFLVSRSIKANKKAHFFFIYNSRAMSNQGYYQGGGAPQYPQQSYVSTTFWQFARNCYFFCCNFVAESLRAQTHSLLLPLLRLFQTS